MGKKCIVLLDAKDFFWNECFGNDKITVHPDDVKELDSANDFLKSTSFEQREREIVLLWHLTGTHDRSFSKQLCKELTEQIDDKYKNLILKIGKSEVGIVVQQAKELAWFDFVWCGRDITYYFKTNDWDIDKCIKTLPARKKAEHLSSAMRFLLQLFLPLDIDMQALGAVEDAERYLNDMYTGLKELYELDKYKERDQNKHYRQKLYDLWYLLGLFKENKKMVSPDAKKLTPIDNPSQELLRLAGLELRKSEQSHIYRFLECLDTTNSEAHEHCRSADYLREPFNLKVNDKPVRSFHDWYCALALCLRG